MSSKGEKARLRECVLRLYSTSTPLYSTCTPLYSTCTPLYSICTPLVLRFPSRSVRVGFGRKVPEIDGGWKQYSGSEKFRIFQRLLIKLLFFPVGNGQKSPEESGDFLTRNTTFDSHRFLKVFYRKQ